MPRCIPRMPPAGSFWSGLEACWTAMYPYMSTIAPTVSSSAKAITPRLRLTLRISAPII